MSEYLRFPSEEGTTPSRPEANSPNQSPDHDGNTEPMENTTSTTSDVSMVPTEEIQHQLDNLLRLKELATSAITVIDEVTTGLREHLEKKVNQKTNEVPPPNKRENSGGSECSPPKITRKNRGDSCSSMTSLESNPRDGSDSDENRGEVHQEHNYVVSINNNRHHLNRYSRSASPSVRGSPLYVGSQLNNRRDHTPPPSPERQRSPYERRSRQASRNREERNVYSNAHRHPSPQAYNAREQPSGQHAARREDRTDRRRNSVERYRERSNRRPDHRQDSPPRRQERNVYSRAEYDRQGREQRRDPSPQRPRSPSRYENPRQQDEREQRARADNDNRREKTERKCIYCGGKCWSSSCLIVPKREDRLAIMRRNGNCFRCLVQHVGYKCNSKHVCKGCGSPDHHQAICHLRIE